ncbi:hypothetical protein HOY82DRAFT_673759 [Tuber indicum]|nr:hypothetical protein HOY82DRAFT_673759 [Tuber indicum]
MALVLGDVKNRFEFRQSSFSRSPTPSSTGSSRKNNEIVSPSTLPTTASPRIMRTVSEDDHYTIPFTRLSRLIPAEDQNPLTNPPVKASTTISSGWRYDFSIFINKQREASDFGYVSKSPNFPSFEIFQDKLSGTIVAIAPKEVIGPTDLDEASWTKIDHEICRLVDQKPKRNLTLSICVDYVTISSGGLSRGGQGQYGGSGITSLGGKGNKKLSATQEQLNRALSIPVTPKARIMSEIQALHHCTGSCPIGREGEVYFTTQNSKQHLHLPYSSVHLWAEEVEQDRCTTTSPPYYLSWFHSSKAIPNPKRLKTIKSSKPPVPLPILIASSPKPEASTPVSEKIQNHKLPTTLTPSSQLTSASSFQSLPTTPIPPMDTQIDVSSPPTADGLSIDNLSRYIRWLQV